MSSTDKMSELMALLDMNDHLLNGEFRIFGGRVNTLLDDRIRMLSDQLVSDMYTDTIRRSEKRRWWNRHS